MLSVLTSGLGVLGVKIVTGFVSGMINRDHSANLAAQNRASQEAMCKARLKSQAELEAARREAQERIEEKRQKFQAYMETERRNFQRELEQNRQESQFILGTRRQEFQRQMEEKRRQFQLELEKERQEFQTYLESNRQQFQLEVNKSNAELQRELSAQNHAFRLEEINTNFELTRRTQEYQQVEAEWPLHVPPVVMRGEQVLKDRTIALRVLFARSSDAYLQKFFYPIIEQELVDFVDLYKNNLSSRNIIFFHNAWKDECYGGAFGNNIHFALSDLPVLIADANVLPSGQIRISLTMWGVGSDTEFHGNIFKCPYDKSRFKDENYVLEIAYKVSAYLKFAIGYVYDLYNLIAYNRMPLLPAAVALEKNNLIDSALLNYEEIKQCLTDTYSRMYSQTLSITDGSQQSVYDTQAEDVQLLVDSKKTILHELRLNYALAVKDYVSTEQYLQCLDESIRAWVDLRTDKSAEEFLQDLVGNGDEVKKYFSDEDKRYFITLCDAYYNAKQKHELGNICLKLSAYVNCKAAIKYYKEEAKQGNTEAQYRLGVCYYLDENYTEAVKLFNLSAKHGNVCAEYMLGKCYYSGKGTKLNYSMAVELFNEAAKYNHAEAKLYLGECYYHGNGIERDIERAFKLYKQSDKDVSLVKSTEYAGYCKKREHFNECRKLAEKGNIEAQYGLGKLYYDGDYYDCIARCDSNKEAAKWYKKAAESGYMDAQYAFAECCRNGYGTGVDTAEAVKWYEKALHQGKELNAEILCFIGSYYYNNCNYTEAIKWLKAAEFENDIAQYLLGRCYYDGNGVNKDHIKAKYYYEKSANNGNTQARFALDNDTYLECQRQFYRILDEVLKISVPRVFSPFKMIFNNKKTIEEYRQDVLALRDRIQNETFKILVIGGWKSGKSTFINALLGEKILPSSNLPSTLHPTIVKYSKQKKGTALIYFNEDIPDDLPFISNKINSWIGRYRGDDIPPIELCADEASQNIRAAYKTKNGDEKEKLAKLYKKIVYFADNELLKDNIEIIDTPGLGESPAGDSIVFDCIGRVDAVVYVINVTKFGYDELSFLHNVPGYEASIFIVVNKIDDLFFLEEDSEEDRQRELKAILEYISMRTEGFTIDPIYPISAMQAIKAKRNGDLELLEQSGIKKFEADLVKHFFNDSASGKFIKLSKACADLDYIISNTASACCDPVLTATMESLQRELRYLLGHRCQFQIKQTGKCSK